MRAPLLPPRETESAFLTCLHRPQQTLFPGRKSSPEPRKDRARQHPGWPQVSWERPGEAWSSVSWDVGPLCLTAQRRAPRHQLYLAMPLRLEGGGGAGSYNQALSFSVALLLCSLVRASARTLVLPPQATLRRQKGLTHTLQCQSGTRGPACSVGWAVLMPHFIHSPGQGRLSAEASSQLISGSRVRTQVTRVSSGAVTPQWPATHWTLCLQPRFPFLHFLMCC